MRSWRSGGRSSRGAFRACAHRTSGVSRTRLRRRGTSRCCRSRLRSRREEIAMEVILREDIDKLGNRGEGVKVASGYARNFLIPKKMAVAGADSTKTIGEQEQHAHLRQE